MIRFADTDRAPAAIRGASAARRALIVAGLVLSFVIAFGALAYPSRASHGAGMDAMAIDVDSAGNSAGALGPRQHCIELLPGATAPIDVTATNIPTGNAITGYGYTLNYESSALTVAGQDPAFLLATNENSLLANSSDPVPDDDANDDWNSAVTDTGAGIPESGSGVLERLRLQVDLSAAAGVHQLTFSNQYHDGQSTTSAPPDTTYTASIAVSVPCDSDADGIPDSSDNCPHWANPLQESPPWPVPPNDPDCDGFSSSVEDAAGTNSIQQCGANAWPADMDSSGFSDITDIVAVTANFGSSVPPAPRRQDIAPNPVDGFVDITDVVTMTALFGLSCTGGAGTPTPTPTPTSTASPTATPSPTPSPSPTPTPTATPTATATPTPTASPSPTPSPTPGTFTLHPVDDAYVQQDVPNNNFGQATTLIVDTQVNQAGSAAEAYIKFDLSSLAGLGINQATLRMWVTNISPNTQTIRQVADDSWTEGAINYNNRPPKGATVTTFVHNSTPVGAWKEVDITSEVAASAGSDMSLAIHSSGSDGFHFNSGEAGSNRLELVTNWSWGGQTATPTPSPTPTASPTPTPTPTPEPPGPTPIPNGYKGPAYTGATAPTGEKPQSKLWFNDGIWWGSLFDTTTRDFHIHRLDWATQTWIDTNVLIDPRPAADVDVLWDGTKLYISSVVPNGTLPEEQAELRRYSYNSATDTYTLDSGFPATIVSGHAMETLVMAKDSTGTLWVTYTRTNAVWVAHTTTNDATWGTPFTLIVPNSSNLTVDDISTIVAFDSKIGVMWGNQTPGIHSYFFATHADGAGDFDWQSSVALPGNGAEMADDHINLKALSGDSAGRVFAAVKTSLNGANDPLIMLLVLKPNGTWTNHTFGTVLENHTRANVLIDQQNRKVYIFAAAPCCSGDVIYYKQTSIDAVAFPLGLGTSFMNSAAPEDCINNVSSTKQNLNNLTNLVVIAGADCTRFYFHNKIELPQP